MIDQSNVRPYLALCRRLGIKYVALSPAGENSPSSLPPPDPIVDESLVMKKEPVPEFKKVESILPRNADPENSRLGAGQGPAVAANAGEPGPQANIAPVKWMTGSPEGIQAMELIAFEKDIHDCQNCPLGKTRKNFVFGSGNPRAEVLFIGEAPGAEEDQQGLPFVGAAGQLLTKIVESTQVWKRPDVFICNILKCRPPGNRTPLPEEVEQCRPYLEEQIRIIRPKLIMAMGASAAQAILRTHESVGKLRNKWHEFEGIPLRVTYHPAALLRTEAYKKDVWEDMKQLTKKYRELTGR